MRIFIIDYFLSDIFEKWLRSSSKIFFASVAFACNHDLRQDVNIHLGNATKHMAFFRRRRQ